MNRRKFISTSSIAASTLGLLGATEIAKAADKKGPIKQVVDTRTYWLETLLKISDPVLNNLAKGELKKNLPVSKEDRRTFQPLEAFGRTLTGLTPWLALGVDETAEGKLRKKYIDLALRSIANATDPNSPDYMDFAGKTGTQSLVDSAFFAYALLLAPNEFWEKSDEKTKANIIKALRDASGIKPYYNNWMLFGAMVETALLKFSGEWDEFKVEMAFRKFDEWYKGDGWYGDGPDFHFDYYNSIVIQPFMLKIIFELEAIKKTAAAGNITFDEPLLKRTKILKISQRFAAQQEMLIAADGSYATFGRSLCYRFGVFHHLSFMSLHKLLPENLNTGQVRSALTAVIQKVMSAPNNFDEKGWLRIGIYGYQPSLSEGYVDTGSLYLCTAVFQTLGLPASDEFWTSAELPWTQKKIWSGIDTRGDYHVKIE